MQLQRELTFEEAVAGVKQLKMEYEKRVVCGDCHGKRTHKGYQPERCYSCGGCGYIELRDNYDYAKAVCSNCDGWGHIVRE